MSFIIRVELLLTRNGWSISLLNNYILYIKLVVIVKIQAELPHIRRNT